MTPDEPAMLHFPVVLNAATATSSGARNIILTEVSLRHLAS